MNLKTSKIHILKKFNINTLPNYTTKYIIINNKFLNLILNDKFSILLLLEKKKLLYSYGLKYKTFKILINKYKSKLYLTYKLNTMLTTKLDILLIYLGICNNINEVRQLINHKKIFINGINITSYNFLCNLYDIIVINNCKFNITYTYIHKLNKIKNYLYFIYNLNKNSILFVNNFLHREINLLINLKLLLENLKF